MRSSSTTPSSSRFASQASNKSEAGLLTMKEFELQRDVLVEITLKTSPVARDFDTTFPISLAPISLPPSKLKMLPKLQIPAPAHSTRPRERSTPYRPNLKISVPTPDTPTPVSTSRTTTPLYARTTQLQPSRLMPYPKRQRQPALDFDMEDPTSRTRGFDKYAPKEPMMHCDCVVGGPGARNRCNHRARGLVRDVILDGEGNSRRYNSERSSRSSRSGSGSYEDEKERVDADDDSDEKKPGGCCCTWASVGSCLCLTIVLSYKTCCEE
ncbi:hypothetical protein BJ165DRAFT_1428022 [Panaeolus papilionaceus]|nr:hypothetical protein BJ165DRAFT_1428022 [Panaeolus papilionaceus]